MEYKVITRKYTNELENKVFEYILKGWKPLGGVSSAFNVSWGSMEYAQAMIKEK